MNPKVSIIILNWNGWKDTINCLESLYLITYSNYDVIVVDNGSEDDSIERIKEYAEGKIKLESKFFEYNSNNKPIYVLEYTREQAEKCGDFRKENVFSTLQSDRKLRLILNEKNYGFAGGNNIGMRYALEVLNTDYILLLNNDTVVNKGFLTELVKVAESDEKIGAVGCKLIYPDGRLQYTGYYMGPYIHHRLRSLYNKIWHNRLTVADTIQSNEILEVDVIFGAAMLIKRKITEKIGLLDEDFFPGYHEETDWCYRARLAGFKVIYDPKVIIIHYEASSSKKLDRNYLYFVWRKNTLRLCLLNHPISWLILEIPGHIITFFGAMLHNQLKYWLKAYWVNFKNLRDILAKRKRRRS